MAAEGTPAAGMPPPIPTVIELPPAPPYDGSIVELSFGKLAAALMWLFQSVELLSKGLAQINQHLVANQELWKRLETLENKPPPEVQTIVQERPRTPPPPPPPPPPEIEIPYVPSEEERAEEARRAVKAMLDEKVKMLLEHIDGLNDKISGLNDRIKTLEDIEANRADPLERMQVYFQEIGFLPYGEPEEKDPLKLLGQVFVLLRQDIAMCPKIKDLEDAENALKSRINQVEADAAADREARSQVAAAESAKIREDLAHTDHLVQGLIKKNEEDGDVAGGLRDLTVRVDTLEARRVPKIENRVKKLEDAATNTVPEEVKVEEPRKKGFLEALGEVDLPEEVRRLRGMVEAIQAAMPYETRQTLEFLKNSPGGQMGQTAQGGQGATQNFGGGANLNATTASQMTMASQQSGAGLSRDQDIDLVNFRTETEGQLERYKQVQTKEQQNMMRNLKMHERKVEGLEAKILDLWGRLPKVLALLEPLQVQMEQTMNAELDGSTGGGPGIAQAPSWPAPVMEGGTGSGPVGGGPGAAAGTTSLGETSPTSPTSALRGATGRGETTQAAAGQGTTSQPGANAGRRSPTFADTKPTFATEPPPSRSPPQPLSGPLGGTLGAGKGADFKPNLTGFTPLAGAAGTGEAKGKAATFQPLAEMGSLTNLIKVALQSTTNEIHADLRHDLLRLRTELLGGLDGKAGKSELAALASRVDAWTQKSRARDRFADFAPRDRDRSSSPTSEMADTRYSSAPPIKQDRGLASPGEPGHRLAENRKGGTCHDKCKEPTCPRSLKMSQSLSRLPALKTVQ